MITRIRSRQRAPALALLSLLFVFAFGLGLSLAACTLPNPDHCQNLAINPNAWCESVRPDQPYCSPCEADNNGCVADEPTPDTCPAYTVPAPDAETGTGTGTDTGTSTDSEGETGDPGTETGTAGA